VNGAGNFLSKAFTPCQDKERVVKTPPRGYQAAKFAGIQPFREILPDLRGGQRSIGPARQAGKLVKSFPEREGGRRPLAIYGRPHFGSGPSTSRPGKMGV
jgi:hypothetical protein